MTRRAGNGVFAFVTIIFLLAVCAHAAAQERSLYRPEDGSFSYEPPSGWDLREFGGQKYQIAFGPPANSFAPNIFVVGEHFPGSLDDYVNANLAAMTQASPGTKVLTRGDFQTDEGQRAVKIAIESVGPGVGQLRQTFYFFDAGARKFTVTCSRLAGSDDAVDATFDTAMRTFAVGSF